MDVFYTWEHVDANFANAFNLNWDSELGIQVMMLGRIRGYSFFYEKYRTSGHSHSGKVYFI